MAIGKEKKSIQAYVTNITKSRIAHVAKEKKLSESKIAGKILDEAFSPVIRNRD